MFEHSSAPWFVQCNEYPIRRIISKNGFWICDVFQVDTEEKTKANVRLIKTSPKLLISLKDVFMALSQEVSEGTYPFIMQKAKEAITEAEKD